MKKTYQKPEIEITTIIEMTAMLAGGSQHYKIGDENGNFNSEEGDIIVIPGTDGPPSTAKGGDFFEESISPSSSSIWGDED